MHRPPLTPRIFLFHSFRLAVLAGTLAVSSGFAQTQASAGGNAPSAPGDVQKLASFVVEESAAKPFQDGNRDIPRTSNDVQPYTIINQEAIQQSNAYDLNDFLKDQLTQNSAGQTGTQAAPTTGNLNGTSSNINLRGLGSLQTLILVNGMRLTPINNSNGQSQPNINGIPLGAVDHVEILPSSASAIYGGSAVGGVINFVLKRNYVGGEVATSYQNTVNTDSPRYALSVNYGFPLGKKVHVSLIASYADGKSLRMQDRPFLMNYNRRALSSAPGIFYSNTVPFAGGTTPNIAFNPAVVNGLTNAQNRTLTLKNGTPLNALTTYIPPDTSASTPAATLASGLLANAGTYNFNWAPTVGQGLYTSIGQISRKESALASITYDLTPQVQFFADFSSYSNSTLTRLLENAAGTGIIVPGNAPTNPFRENVLITLPLAVENGAYQTVSNETRSMVFGLLAHLPANWQLAAEFASSRNVLSLYRYVVSFNNQIGAGGAGNGAAGLLYNGTVNPFVDTIKYLTTILSDYTPATTEFPTNVLNDVALRASGPLGNLPGGKVQMSIGLEGRTDSLKANTIYNTATGALVADNEIRYSPGARQATQSGYLETRIPVISAKNQFVAVNAFELQAALRREEFKNVSNSGTVTSLPSLNPPTVTSTILPTPTRSTFKSTNPTLGLKYKPVRAVTFRASYATAFVPPTNVQLATNPNSTTTITGAFFDPVTGQTYTAQRNSGTNGNPDLKPQTTKNWNVGMIWEPAGTLLEGLRMNLEFFNIVENDVIAAPPAVQILVNTPAESANVIRSSPTGPITFINFRYSNVSLVRIDGWDFSVDYRKRSPVGTFNLHGGATLTEHLKQSPAVGAPLVEYVGFVNSGGVDKLKANAVLSCYLGSHWVIGWRTNYYAGYKQNGAPSDPQYLGAAVYTPITTNTLPQGRATIPAQTYHNLFASYSFGTSPGFHRLLAGVTIQLGINDVFNTAPPYDAYSGYAPYYYSPFGNPELRSYVLKIRKTF